MRFGARLKQIRTERNLTQPQFAELIGIEQSYLSKLENDKSQPSAEMFGNITTALGMAPADFLADLDGETQASLRHMPQVGQFLEGVKVQRIAHVRQWTYGAAAAGALGFALMLAANDGIFFPNNYYKYTSKGVLQPGEAENLFDQFPLIQEMRKKAQTITPEEHARLLAEFLSQRVKHVTVESARDRGTVYFEDVPGGRRKFDLVKVTYTRSTANRILQYLGALLAFCGPLILLVEWRLRSVSKRIESENK